MSWTVDQLRHNAAVLYNHLCSVDAEKVYVDGLGHLQFDDRSWVARKMGSIEGDFSRKATDAAALRTMRRVMRALEDKTLDPRQIIPGQAMQALQNSKKSSMAGWVDKDTFAIGVKTSSRFWKHLCGRDRSQKPERTVPAKVDALSLMICWGLEGYREVCKRDGKKDMGYDKSDGE